MTPSVPAGWLEWQLLGLHPDLRAALVPAIEEALCIGIRPRYLSGPRTNAHQLRLRTEYENKAKLFAAGKITKLPLPAAPPGKSAHNYALCSVDKTHRIGPNERCPKCGAVTIPASLACDIWLADLRGEAIPSGGAIPREVRDRAWQDWAAVLDRHPLLRDGGEFQPRPDTPHVELARWDFRSQTLREPVEAAA